MYAVFPRCRLRINLLAVPSFFMMLYLEGLLPTGLLLLSAFLHEGGHLLAIRYVGAPIRRVDLLPMGGLIVYDQSSCSPMDCALVSAAGPMANLLAFFLCLPIASRSPYLLFFALANAFLALLNLLPWEVLDGGNLLFCLLLARRDPLYAERVCKAVSRVSSALLALLFVLLGLSSRFPLWYLLLSAMLLVTAFR